MPTTYSENGRALLHELTTLDLTTPGVRPQPLVDARFIECLEKIVPGAFPIVLPFPVVAVSSLRRGIEGLWVHKPYAIVVRTTWGSYRNPAGGGTYNGCTGYTVTMYKHPSKRLNLETNRYFCWDTVGYKSARVYGKVDPVVIMDIVNGFRAKFGISIPPAPSIPPVQRSSLTYRKECHGHDLWMDRIEKGVGIKDYLIAKNALGCESQGVCKEGDTRGYGVCPCGTLTGLEVCHEKRWVPVTCSCTNGTRRFPHTCADGTVIYEAYCSNNTWVLSGERCPEVEHNEWLRKELSYYGTLQICNKAAEGTKAVPVICSDGRAVHKKICQGGKWVPTGETCLTKVYNEGDKRNPTTCWNDSVIHAERFNATLKKWVPTGEICPTKPECTEGDKKAGYVCVAGKWQLTPVVPAPVPPVEPVPYVPPVEPVPYVPPVEPVLPVIPPADEMFTIEFQEMISGVKPPRVPLLVPGLETLPLLPGWIIRDAAGNIVNRGAELPTLPGFMLTSEP